MSPALNSLKTIHWKHNRICAKCGVTPGIHDVIPFVSAMSEIKLVDRNIYGFSFTKASVTVLLSIYCVMVLPIYSLLAVIALSAV